MTQVYRELVSANDDVNDDKLEENTEEDPNLSQGKDVRSADIVESSEARSIQKTRQIAVLKMGQYFGERALLQNDVRGATGTVEDACSCTICPRLTIVRISLLSCHWLQSICMDE